MKYTDNQPDSFGILFSKRKLLLLLPLGLAMVAVSVVCIVADGVIFYHRVIAVFGALFFSLCTIICFRRLFGLQLFLVINSRWVDIAPSRQLRIEWKDISDIYEVTIHRNKLIVLGVNNPEYWFEYELSFIRRKLMQTNMAICGSPFNISSNSAQISHKELLELLLAYKAFAES